MFPKINPTTTQAWQALARHRQQLQGAHMREWFINDPMRFREFSLYFKDVLWDFSKNIITPHTLKLLYQLFEECGVTESIKLQFEGNPINQTEGRAVLHTALRNFSGKPVLSDGRDVMPGVKEVLAQMKSFSQKIESGEWKGRDGRPITDVVNIGIGGSDLGPVMVYEALRPYRLKNINCHFVSNVDGAQLAATLQNLDSATTLFIIASKTFTTQETMTNAHSAREWFLRNGGTERDIAKHFVAVSTNAEAVEAFGIDTRQMFGFWDWVGGRYSVWSAIGLSLCCGLGYQNFEDLLRGAHEMDEHFRSQPFHQNIPMLMAAIGIWYVNFWEAHSEAIIPYDQSMHRFAAYFQQGNMESNGKSVDRNGQPVNYATGPVVWGEPGTNGQHAFFQLMHQGTGFIPCDFIGFAQSHYPMGDHHQKLMANFFAQTEALMRGLTREEVADNAATDLEKFQVPYRVFEGNRPTTTILAPKLTPSVLGSLVAAYEHKIFVQGVVWNVFSYDQWGVELGKKMAGRLLPKLEGEGGLHTHDSSTSGLIQAFHQMRN